MKCTKIAHFGAFFLVEKALYVRIAKIIGWVNMLGECGCIRKMRFCWGRNPNLRGWGVMFFDEKRIM